MQDTDNTGVVKQAYAAFGRGDIHGILNTSHDDVVWKPINGAADHVPTAGERRGKAGVREFFEILAHRSVRAAGLRRPGRQSDHGELWTDEGCRVLLVVPPEDYLPPVVR